jgi:hypothetical protein
MGRWRWATLKEYIREELACFSEGMPTSTKKKFDFVVVVNRNFKVHVMGHIFKGYRGNVCAPLD